MGYEQIPDWLQAIGTLLIGISTVFGGWVAWKGWKQQLRGQNEYELASKLLAGTYKMRDDLDFVRHPFIRVHEMTKDGEDPPSTSDREKSRKATLYAYENRWNKVNETRQEIYELLIRAEAIWGEEIKALFGVYFRHAMKIYHKLEDMLEIYGPSRKEKSNFYRTDDSDPENPIDQEQEEIIGRIEAFLKPKLKS